MINATDSAQRVINIFLKRDRQGIKVRFRVSPEVEAFFRENGGGLEEGPAAGRLWSGLNKEQKLSFWTFGQRLARDNEGYSLNHTGAALFNEMGGVNLSFIRMVGATEWKDFVCDGVMSQTELNRIADQLRRASTHFYMEYIQPVHLNVFVGVRDVVRDDQREVGDGRFET